MLRTLMREFHTPANWVAFNAGCVHLSYLDNQVLEFIVYKVPYQSPEKHSLNQRIVPIMSRKDKRFNSTDRYDHSL